MLLAVAVAVATIGVGAVVVQVASSGAERPSRASAPRAGLATRPPRVFVELKSPARVPRGASYVTIGRPTASPPIPAGFVGLSFEYYAVEPYAGTDPAAIDPVLVQLIRNLAPGQAPVLRIGGDSTDWTWWPVPHMARPGGITFTLDRRWLAVTRALAQATGAKLILGINLEADSSKLAAAEANALVDGIGRGRIEALEPGNEPELYGTFAWYTVGGQKVTGRPAGYDFADFTDDFSRIARALPEIPLAGPSIGIPTPVPGLGQFIVAEPRLGLVTFHAYPLLECFTKPSSPRFPTIPRLLTESSSRGLADSLRGYVATSRRHGLALRVDEAGTVGCGNAPGVSDTFATALWALDTSFQMARVGVAGINIHTYPGATSQLFTFTHQGGSWSAFVEPEYYGLLMFAQAAPPGARLLRIATRPGDGLRAWATRAPDGTTRVVLINDLASRRVVAVRGPGTPAPAMLERLKAPGVGALRGVTLGGQSFGTRTNTGTLDGAQLATLIAPAGREYVVTVPAGSAAMLTFRPSR